MACCHGSAGKRALILQGVPQHELEAELQLSGEDILQVINQLLSQNLVDALSGGKNKDLIFKLKDADQAMKCGRPPVACIRNPALKHL